MGPEIHAPSIFVRTFWSKNVGDARFLCTNTFATVWAPSEAMSDFYADRSRLDGGRPQGASSELSCDLDAVGGGMVAFGLACG
ncbi:hypothetical protein FA13DRAFT_1733465 [Coprinellus micaceus]|uniref:Uncharacterized protein n=1 Tax=Coprinellus micaceus TaxID=71717 RepID=A0A4Y7T932_COPMI|nr:hypothetical protein FA13DRAFT_1733465 [Coprinellus micaceus]